MSDFADLAAEREQQLRDDALARQRRKAAPRTAIDDETDLVPVTCLICDEPIPESRRLAIPGVPTCVDCQAELEKAVQKGSRR